MTETDPSPQQPPIADAGAAAPPPPLQQPNIDVVNIDDSGSDSDDDPDTTPTSTNETTPNNASQVLQQSANTITSTQRKKKSKKKKRDTTKIPIRKNVAQGLAENRKKEWDAVFLEKYEPSKSRANKSFVYDHVKLVSLSETKLEEDQTLKDMPGIKMMMEKPDAMWWCCLTCKNKQEKSLSRCLFVMDVGNTSNAAKHVRDSDLDHKTVFKEVQEKKNKQEVSVFLFVLF
jgi:hypothetical protein